MTPPTVSIIVPNYNHSLYLRQRFDSIFNQSFQDFEIIILDDCSTDNSKEIIEEYQNRPQISHVIYNETNSGSPFKQWAKGFELARGKYVWIAESDDWAELNFLERTVEILESKKNISFVFSASVVANGKALSINSAFPCQQEMPGMQFLKSKMILDNGVPNASAVLFRASLLKSIPNDYQNYRGSGDCLFWIHLCELGDVYFIPEPLNNCRIHQGNTTQKCRNDGTACAEAFRINQYLLERGYVSFWEKCLLLLKNIERIDGLKKNKSFSKNVNLDALIKQWRKANLFVFLKVNIVRLFAIVQKTSFRLGIIKEPKNPVYEFFKDTSFVALTWNLFGLPSVGLRKLFRLKKSVIRAYLEQAVSYIKRPLDLFDNWASMGRLNWMPDKWYLSLMFRSRMGYWMDWKHPKTFNEKLQWLKIHDRNPLYTRLVDKYEVRKYVAEKIGDKYLIPLWGVWNNTNEIEFEKLPNQFVIKCTHDSGSVIICRDEKKIDIASAIAKIKKSLSRNFYYVAREWPYKNVEPRIVIEQYLENEGDNDLIDYKFFCFNGVPKFMYISSDHALQPTTDFYDMNFNRLQMRMRDPNSNVKMCKPRQFDKMKELSAILASGIPHVRIDFYCVGNQVYFGEMTFFHNAGFFPLEPPEMNNIIGEYLSLNVIQKNGSR